MVSETSSISRFTAKIEADCEENISAKISGRWLKILPNNFAAKTKIETYLMEKRFQLYVVSDLQAPLKVVIRGLPNSISQDKIMNELNKKSSMFLK